MKADKKTEASPMKSLLEEIETFRGLFRETLKAYGSRIDGEVNAIRIRVEAIGTPDEIPAAKLRDMRDMLTLLRHIDVKPGKARRKDLKKLDSVVGDLAILVENW